jgi:hemolysin III
MSSFPVYTRAERLFDAAVHMVGVSGALAGLVTLIVLAALGLDLISVVAVLVYGVGLVLTFTFSAAYNLVQQPCAKAWLRRLDHAAIFIMIAGTYTPFALLKLPPESGLWLLGLVWGVAIVGVFLKLFLPGRFERSSVALYLLQGWAIVWLIDTLVGSLSSAQLVLLAVGGGLYTLGVVFHLWEKLPFQNGIWHLFVLAAASCHFAAVLVAVA